MREERTEVLVAGAGPVGLWSALLLARAGLEVVVVDREERTTARSYACALHPGTLRRFEKQGLAAPLIERGRRVQTVAFYDGAERRAEVRLGEIDGDFPFLVILPQSALESLLEEELQKAGVPVCWNHRLADFQQDTRELTASIEELGGSAGGYVVPHWGTVVKRTAPVRAQFLIGADGHHSLARQRLGIESERAAGPFFFAAYEFEAESAGVDEARVVLDDQTTNVLWPLPGNKYRWTFQIERPREPDEFPQKERRAARLAQPEVDERIRQYVRRVAGKRAPWFTSGVRAVTWCTEVVFEHRVARRFGENRCCLAGDAAHQAGPVGVQSMNLGFAEGESLATLLRGILREDASPATLDGYDTRWQSCLRGLLGLTGGLKPRPETAPWVRSRAGRILPCLPALGADLTRLAGQLKLDMP